MMRGNTLLPGNGFRLAARTNTTMERIAVEHRITAAGVRTQTMYRFYSVYGIGVSPAGLGVASLDGSRLGGFPAAWQDGLAQRMQEAA
jgi:hypothetical protein